MPDSSSADALVGTDAPDALSAVPDAVLLPPPPTTTAGRAVFEAIACSSYPTQLLVALGLALLGLRPQLADGSLNATYVAVVALGDTLLVTVLIVWFLRRSGESLAAVALGARPVGREMLSGIGLVPAVMLGVSLVILAVRTIQPAWHNVPVNPLTALLADRTTALTLGVVVVVAGGLREELQRAFQLHRLTPCVMGPWSALLVTSAAFGLGHTLQGYDVAIGTGALGVVWGTLYLRRRSAVAAATCHALFNLGQIVIAWAAYRPA